MTAIPSPDLLVNLFASGAQVLGLLAVALGGTWFAKGRLAGDEERKAGSQWPFRVTLLLLVGVSVAFTFYVLRTQDSVHRRLQTNLVRKSTENGKKVGDTSLKTLGFSDQLKHPRAVGTETLASWIAEAKPMNLIDIREPEEIELGAVPGCWKRRFPDLRQNREGLIVPGKETILLCDSGNRSSELVDIFTAEGIACRFMIGGYEKWVAERRPLVDAGPRSSLRDIPDYPTKTVLLDTPEVERLVRDEEAIFVDVRYPEEFAKGALPGAINLTLRKMLLAEIEQSLKGLPRRPVVVPCYDKRSSFFGMLLGLRLHRLGLDFRGRYTVPHEYWVPSAEPKHIATWNAEHEELTAFSLATNAVAAKLDSAGWALGSLLLAILIVVALTRALLLPLTLKADRDQLVLRRLAGGIAELRARHANDPARARAEILALHRASGLTPVRNLLGTLLQLTVFVVLFAAVGVAATEQTAPFLWLTNLGTLDPLHVLPCAVGAMFLAMLLAMSQRLSAAKAACQVALSALLTAAVWTLPAAQLLYLLLNLGLMLVQRAVYQSWWQRREARRLGVPFGRVPEPSPERPVLPLCRVEHVASAGRKARRLSRLSTQGFPVPPGFVVCDARGLDDERGRRAIERAFAALRAPLVAVRSSGVAEDGESLSHAGEFASHLQVPGTRLLQAIADVEQSLHAPHSRDAARRDEGGVLVQAMVPAEHAGVLFTEDPACAGAMLIEMTKGLGDGLVSGQVDPDSFRFGRLTSKPLQQRRAPIDLAELLELGRRAERLFGRPQDIEWAWAKGRFFVLQSRDITCRAHDTADATNPHALREAERARLLALASTETAPEQALLAQNELSELLPEPTPLSLALMTDLWGKDGSVERAAKRLGIPYKVGASSAPYAVSVFGRLYVNRREESRRFARGVGALASLQLVRGAAALERGYRERFLPRFQKQICLREAIDWSRLSLAELARAFTDARDHFVHQSYVEAEVVNLASTVYASVARRRLRRAGHTPAELLCAIAPTILPRLVATLRICGEEGVASSLEQFGHRAPHDFELAEPRYDEDPEEVRRLVAAAREGAETTQAAAADARLTRVDKIAVETANRFEALKEEAKHEVLRELACLRALVLEIGRRLDLGDGVFWLLPEEIETCAAAGPGVLHERVAQRRAARAAMAAIELPAELSFADLEALGSPFAAETRPTQEAADGARLRGLRVAGTGNVYGRARVLRDPRETDSFEDGDVLVARFTDPRWLPLFRRARGIVTEVGGWLSHAAIQAREHRLPAIVGVRGVMAQLRDGDMVCLRSDGSVEKLEDRRREARTRTTEPVLLRVGMATLSGEVTDLSEGGLRVAQLSADVDLGQAVEVMLGDVSAVATVVHRTGRTAGLQLHAPLARVAQRAGRVTRVG